VPHAPLDNEDDNSVSLLDCKSPWTYGNDHLDPGLVPSSSLKRWQDAMYSAVPPYHPSYIQARENGKRIDNPEYGEYDSASSGGDYATGNLRKRCASAGGTQVRRGSYGEIEVWPVNREEKFTVITYLRAQSECTTAPEIGLPLIPLGQYL